MVPHVIEIIEGTRKAMGPAISKFHPHGQQRLLMTLGQAYARQGNREKARSLFDEALAVNGTSREAGLIKKSSRSWKVRKQRNKSRKWWIEYENSYFS